MARHFNGTSDSIISATGALDSASHASISTAFWWNADSSPGATTVHIPFAIQVGGTTAIRFDWDWISSAQIYSWEMSAQLQYTTALVGSAWYHLAATWDGTTLVSYLNGAFSGSATRSLSWPASLRFYLGRGGGGNNTAGIIADAGIWSTALSAEQIAALANGYRANHVRSDSMMVYWPILGLSPEPDRSMNAALINGTVTGTTIVADPPQLEPWAPSYPGFSMNTSGTILVLPAQEW